MSEGETSRGNVPDLPRWREMQSDDDDADDDLTLTRLDDTVAGRGRGRFASIVCEFRRSAVL